MHGRHPTRQNDIGASRSTLDATIQQRVKTEKGARASPQKDGKYRDDEQAAEQPPQQNLRQRASAERRASNLPRRPRRASLLFEELLFINVKSVDAVFAETDRARQALRDIRNPTALLANLDDLTSRRDKLHATAAARRRHSASSYPTPPQRRNSSAGVAPSAPLSAPGSAAASATAAATAASTAAATGGALPGAGHRKASMLLPGRDPGAAEVRERAQVAAAAGKELEQSLQAALRRWGVPKGATALNLKGVPLGKGDYDALGEILKQNLPYSELDLSEGELLTAPAGVLARALAFNTTLKTLVLDRCHASDAALRAVAEAVTVNRGLASLSVRGCQGISRPGLELLFRALTRNPHIATVNGLLVQAMRRRESQVLDLRNWPLPLPEALLVAHQLRLRGNGLVHIDLSKSNISSDGFGAVAEALLGVGTTTLERLRLGGNRIDGRAMKDLARLAAANENLVEIDLSDNVELRLSAYEPFGRALLALVADKSKATSLTTFNLSGSGADALLVKAVDESLAVNKALREEPEIEEYLDRKFVNKAPVPLVPPAGDCRVLRSVDVAFMKKESIAGLELTME